MKRLMFSVLCLWLMAVGKANADNTLSVESVTIPKGGQATMEIACSFETVFKGFQLDLELNNDGMVTPTMSGSKPVATLEFTGTDHSFSNRQLDNGEEPPVLLPNYRYLCVSMTLGDVLPTSGKLMSIVLNADANAEVGQTYQVKLSGIEFTGADNDRYVLNDVPFSITIGEPADTRVLIDEDETSVPAAATGVDVRVKRSIVAGVWNTICLPFAMTAAQVKTAFGNGVLLGDFDGCETEYDNKDNVTGLTVNFKSATAIEANHPYIIKVESDIDEFTVDNVDVSADEDEALIEFDNGKTGSRRVVYSGFYGTYKAETTLDEQTLFLYDNKFWYSTGATKMKALRAYFAFLDVLDSYGTNTNARMKIVLNETTGIEGMRAGEKEGMKNEWYTLDGRTLQGEPTMKGAYVNNGRVIIK